MAHADTIRGHPSKLLCQRYTAFRLPVVRDKRTDRRGVTRNAAGGGGGVPHKRRHILLPITSLNRPIDRFSKVFHRSIDLAVNSLKKRDR